MHVARRYHVDVVSDGRVGEHVIARDVVGRAVIPEFDAERVATKGLDESLELALCGARPLVHQRSGEWTLATARKDQPVFGVRRDALEREARTSFFTTRQVRLTEHRRKMAIPLG